jgi:hypothetical protein
MLEDKLVIENADIIFKNFSGMVSQFNPEGKRNFCVVLDDELAAKLTTAGYNVRHLAGQTEGDTPKPYMQVAVSYDKKPPSIMLVTKKNKTRLTEEDVKMLDYAEISKVDLIINPYPWSVNGNSGVKAYLASMYVTIEEDQLAEKYAEIPDGS